MDIIWSLYVPWKSTAILKIEFIYYKIVVRKPTYKEW